MTISDIRALERGAQAEPRARRGEWPDAAPATDAFCASIGTDCLPAAEDERADDELVAVKGRSAQ